ncbi:hypothetical protein ACU639_00670 [Streptomyces cynarae]|uniref:hypothetical protein n=1 Tax=Streptomyces cynarae TaxID=2981134 RepID=UPI00406C68F5
MNQPANTGPAGAVQTAEQEAAKTADQARQAAGEVVSTAGEQARTVVDQAKAQAGGMARDLRGRVVEQADTQTRRGAGAVRQWADELSALADRAEEDSPTKNVVAQAAERGRRAADYLDRRGAEGLVSDVQDFARRRPGLFLGGALLAGFTAGRLAKAGKAAGDTSPGSTPGTQRASGPDVGAGSPREIPDYPYEPTATNPTPSTPHPEL